MLLNVTLLIVKVDVVNDEFEKVIDYIGQKLLNVFSTLATRIDFLSLCDRP